METYNDYAQLASDNNLKCGHVTGGRNGYPEPYLGAFIHGFDSYRDIENFVVNLGGRVVLCKQRDGWGVFEKHSNRTSPLTADDYIGDLGENATIVDKDVLFGHLLTASFYSFLRFFL